MAANGAVIGVSLKLYLDLAQSRAWLDSVAQIARTHPVARDPANLLFVLPSLPALATARATLADTSVQVGAQDLFWEDRGPYTGAVSGADLRAAGCSLVEIGHAERRIWFGETAAQAHRKFTAAQRNGLTPVVCVGERDQVDPVAAIAECAAQLRAVLGDPRERSPMPVIVAYEPEWAIGSAAAAEPEHIGAVARALHEVLDEWRWPQPPRVIYGGSAQPGLLPLLGPDVDGLFMGRFAHAPDRLRSILDDVEEVYGKPAGAHEQA